MKKMFALFYASYICSILFCLCALSWNLDISLTAFPLSFLYSAVIVWVVHFKWIKNNNPLVISAVRKLLQYQPFVLLAAFILRRAGEKGTVYVVDVIAVLLWCAITVLSFIILYHLDTKRLDKINPEWKQQVVDFQKNKKKGAFYIFAELIDWIDALIQAVCMVLLIQIFVVQLYQIPSESMVPEFLINDRVIVFKTISGPKFPLSDFGIPVLRSYKRGNIVVFRNPHYQIDRKSEIRTVVSQLVYMLTFTKVNLNVDEQGGPKADPLVKRITGEPGEQLVMQDGTLYARTSNSSFKPVEQESTWAAWNLNALDSETKRKVQTIPVPEDIYQQMLKCEKERRELDIEVTKKECRDLANQFAALVVSIHPTSISSSISNLFSAADLYEYNLFRDTVTFTRKLATSIGGVQWFTAFMTDWIDKVTPYTDTQGQITGDRLVGGDIYSDANFKLNLLIKLTLGRMVVSNMKIMAGLNTPSDESVVTERNELIEKASRLHATVTILDLRNMPVFPANKDDGSPQYIPQNCYFMMGDNRFNSLDMRHSYEDVLTKLTPYDTYSVTYVSNMAPQYVNKRLILGTTAFRFWPINRLGPL
ncbi:MAG: signal peptidase I [Treponema sp.]|nr:signal peptidase I [Treponema sp.]